VKEYSEGVKGIVDVVPTPTGAPRPHRQEARGDHFAPHPHRRNDDHLRDRGREPQPAAGREGSAAADEGIRFRTRRIGSRVFTKAAVDGRREARQQILVYGGQVECRRARTVAERKSSSVSTSSSSSTNGPGYNVGVGWPTASAARPAGPAVFQNQYTFDFITRTSTQAQAQIVNQPLPRLDIAARRGWVKVAKQSSVITANGNEATFQNGGQTNFLISTGFAANLVSVNFGTNVTVLPRYDSNTRDVEIKLAADVADLTPPNSANGPPGRTTTKLDVWASL
jgi:pilus assembly protein CpaC